MKNLQINYYLNQLYYVSVWYLLVDGGQEHHKGQSHCGDTSDFISQNTAVLEVDAQIDEGEDPDGHEDADKGGEGVLVERNAEVGILEGFCFFGFLIYV